MEKLDDKTICNDCGIPYESYKRVKERIQKLERGDIREIAKRYCDIRSNYDRDNDNINDSIHRK